jgi:flagellar biosynthesis/type III secretory pathway protein FliH
VEPQPPQSPAGSSKAKEWLKEELENLQNSFMHRCRRMRAFVSNRNRRERLLVLQKVTEVWNQQAEDQKKILETMEND